MKEHIVLRKIGNVLCRCKDVGCNDFDQAMANRDMVATKDKVIGYQEAEEALEHSPLNMPLASWIPQGNLPQVGKKVRRQFGGEDLTEG